VQFITDNTVNYMALGKKLAKKFGLFFWTPCVAHCIDLMLEDIGSMDEIKHTIEGCQEVTKFIYNQS
jgi:hypothetical protein